MDDKFEITSFKKEESCFIEASAGTGKTFTIQLMVAKMIKEKVPLKKILIVTYTDKAAGELRDRIRKKISEVLEKKEISKDLPVNDSELSLFKTAYQDVDNAAIFTIHSFCQKALKEYAYDAGRPFAMAMVDDAAVEDLIDRKIRDDWEEELKDVLNGDKNTSSVLKDIKKPLINAINLYKGKSDCEDKPIILLDKDTFSWNGEEIDGEKALELASATDYFNALCVFSQVKTNYEKLKQHARKSFDASQKYGDGVRPKNGKEVSAFIESIEGWKGSGKAGLFNGNSYGDTVVRAEPQELFDALSYFYSIKDEVCGLISEKANNFAKKYPINKFLYSHTECLFEEWQKLKAEKKLQSFNDMILSVHQAVLSPDNSLKTRLRAQYQYAIIDEFQDTNQLQWDIFRNVFLKDGKERVPGHSIYVVGDPKQSIYSFQGADVNVYEAAIEEIEKDGKRYTLKNNFRSTNGIIEGCNELFANHFFDPADGMPELIKFKGSLPPEGDNADKQKAAPQIDGVEKPSIWISEKDISPENFAATAVAKIAEWCSYQDDGKTTKLQVFDKDDCKKLRNVHFSDFAILAKSRSEMEVIEGCMRNVGVPYARYKEGNLFKSKECAEWIAVFRAINAPDFSSWNRRLLSEVLITDFFKDVVSEREKKSRNGGDGAGLEELHFVESKEFDNPNNPERMSIAVWRSLALKRRYAEMLERIYKDTQIVYRLMDMSNMQSLARLRQIGNYAVDYLYNHRCSLEDLVRHLQGLAHYEESADDENGDLIEKGSDFDAVQVMTIHASKGLEFPVVISVAGFKGYYDGATGPFLYHKGNEIHLGFGTVAKANRKNEELEEWKRLFYVDFTRASSILVLPRYEQKDGYDFLSNAFSDAFIEKCEKMPTNTSWLHDQGKLLANRKKHGGTEKTDIEIILSHGVDTSKNAGGSPTQSIDQMSELQSALPELAILQYSYSSLASRVAKPDANNQTNTEEIENADESRADKDDSSQESSSKAKDKQKEIDPDVVLGNDESAGNALPEPLSQAEEKYPRGAKIGNVLHNTLEKSEFENFGKPDASFEEWRENVPAKLKNIIKEEFNAESLPLAAHEDEWMDITLRYLYNTLHAALPVIAGGKFVEPADPIRLVELPPNAHKPEVQFGLNADVKDKDPDGNDMDSEALATLHRVCKGFIDLLFVRGKGNDKRYSILDWKSDLLDDYTPKSVKEKVDEEYSVQRVLYSYCLIKWLKNFEFCKGMSEQEIFDKHFGGIYYAFLRGTDGKTSKGIYAQTWKDFAALKAAYKNVKDLMKQGKKQEGES